MQMREREPAAKRLVLGNLVMWTRSLQFPQGDLYKNESQTSFLFVLQPVFLLSQPQFVQIIAWGNEVQRVQLEEGGEAATVHIPDGF